MGLKWQKATYADGKCALVYAEVRFLSGDMYRFCLKPNSKSDGEPWALYIKNRGWHSQILLTGTLEDVRRSAEEIFDTAVSDLVEISQYQEQELEG